MRHPPVRLGDRIRPLPEVLRSFPACRDRQKVTLNGLRREPIVCTTAGWHPKAGCVATISGLLPVDPASGRDQCRPSARGRREQPAANLQAENTTFDPSVRQLLCLLSLRSTKLGRGLLEFPGECAGKIGRVGVAQG